MDSSIPLPKKSANNCVAICLNSQSELLTSGPRGKWVSCTREYIDSWFINMKDELKKLKTLEVDKLSKAGQAILKKFGQRASCANCVHSLTPPMKFAVCTKTDHRMVDAGRWICSYWEFHGDLEVWYENGKRYEI